MSFRVRAPTPQGHPDKAANRSASRKRYQTGVAGLEAGEVGKPAEF